MIIKLLFVGKSETTQQQLQQLASFKQQQVKFVTTAETALEVLAREAMDVLITEIPLPGPKPGMTGMELLAQCQRQYPRMVTTVITEQGTIDMAVQALRFGAADFLSLPATSEKILTTIETAIERSQRVNTTPTANGGTTQLIAQSVKMRKMVDQATAIAPFNTTVLITGETGTGKELIARHIHQHSTRKQRAFIALNCAAIPDQLLEDELFGHVKGAFTGAQNSREGRFECADGGTLFLDEIGDMSLPLQAKLLRVLQEREFEKLGSSRTIKVDVRIIAATSADLEQRVKEGTFRLDLFYRLNVMHLRLPPLHERSEDIPLIAEQLLARFCAGVGLPTKHIDDQVWEVLQAYQWPGNVRQLQNAMERAAAISGAADTIHIADLPEEIRQHAPATPPSDMRLTPTSLVDPHILPLEGLSLDAVVTNIERELLLRSLNQTGGNKMQAAKLLKMKRTTFVEKLKRLQIEDPPAAPLSAEADPIPPAAFYPGAMPASPAATL